MGVCEMDQVFAVLETWSVITLIYEGKYFLFYINSTLLFLIYRYWYFQVFCLGVVSFCEKHVILSGKKLIVLVVTRVVVHCLALAPLVVDCVRRCHGFGFFLFALVLTGFFFQVKATQYIWNESTHV